MKSVATGLRLLVVATLCLNMTSSLVAMDGAVEVSRADAAKMMAAEMAYNAYNMFDAVFDAPFKAARWVKGKCPCLSLENSILVTTTAGAVMATPGVITSCANELAAVNALTGVAVAAKAGTTAVAATAHAAAIPATAATAAVVPVATALEACGTAAVNASASALAAAPKLAATVAASLQGLPGYAVLAPALQTYIVAAVVWYVAKVVCSHTKMAYVAYSARATSAAGATAIVVDTVADDKKND